MEKHKPLWTSYFIAKSLNLELKFSKNNTFSSLNTNSRLTKPNSLFIAIKGEKFDGHDFITQAIANGASGILCSQDYMNIHQTSIQAQLFPAQNTLMAFRLLAKTWRKQFSIPIIAIGGSVGKTTTKELVASMLHGKYKNILKTQGSQNGFIGIPMTLVELNSSHEIAVIEIGIDEIGAMKNHLETVAPTHGLITTIGPEHIERLLNIKKRNFQSWWPDCS
ncbi:MAG: hypothetical protein HY072_03850 [Deltaproteobacteria bacterium]|nr:hypothetical protein [Deltaproteobacteria bacterium]